MLKSSIPTNSGRAAGSIKHRRGAATRSLHAHNNPITDSSSPPPVPVPVIVINNNNCVNQILMNDQTKRVALDSSISSNASNSNDSKTTMSHNSSNNTHKYHEGLFLAQNLLLRKQSLQVASAIIVLLLLTRHFTSSSSSDEQLLMGGRTGESSSSSNTILINGYNAGEVLSRLASPGTAYKGTVWHNERTVAVETLGETKFARCDVHTVSEVKVKVLFFQMMFMFMCLCTAIVCLLYQSLTRFIHKCYIDAYLMIDAYNEHVQPKT